MAFAIRKMFSNISYFSKSGNSSTQSNDDSEDVCTNRRRNTLHSFEEPSKATVYHTEADSTSKQPVTNLKLPETLKKFTAKKGSLSDTDLLAINNESAKNRRLKNKNLKLDIKKASQSMTENISRSDNIYIENTPKHISLDCRSADMFSEKLRKLNFDQSFEFNVDSDTSDEDVDIESLSECTETDSAKENDKSEIKMCRKVEVEVDNQLIPSTTPESFGDVEFDQNEEERISLLLSYQMKFEKMECVLKKLLSEFQFHIEVSKIFNSRSVVTALPGTNISNIPKTLGQVTYMDNMNRDNPTESWNIIMEKEDNTAKNKLRKQLTSLKNCIETFNTNYLQNRENFHTRRIQKRSITFDLHKGKRMHKSNKVTIKKRIKHFDFPDFRDAFLNLFKTESEIDESDTTLNDSEHESQKCGCNCHNQSLNQTDSGLKTENVSNQSITSSIGNFSLDSTTLSAYSESLDQVISYNSFQDTSLINTLLQKPAIERITFYVQVHSVQLKCETIDSYESKNSISFYCPSCEITETDESSLLEHILSQTHCEKIHFLYKTAYIKKCVASGKEIQPSTVLNPMRMYRDDNKIVCFGDAMYACSLCFENLIIGESVLMQHCGEQNHIDRREKLDEMFD